MSGIKTLLQKLTPPATRRAVRGFVHQRLYALLKPRVLRFSIDGKRVFLSSTADVDLNRVTFGDNLWLWHGTSVNAENGVEFGEHCYVGERVQILTHSAHIQVFLYGREFNEPSMGHAGRVCGPVKIGSFCFVGPNSVIMPGTTIGRGSLVNAFSYVQGEFPPFSVIGGQPAKRLGDSRGLVGYYLKRNPEVREYYEAWALEDV